MYFRNMAREFRRLARNDPKPDVIVTALTPLDLSFAGVEYALKIDCPVIVDVRDMWPDTWAELAPQWCRPMARLALQPYYNYLRGAVRGATAVTGITEAAVDWALDAVGRRRGPLDRAFPLVYPSQAPERDKVAAATAWWRERGVGGNSSDIIGCYFGALSPRADFQTPIQALRELPDDLRSRVKLVLCGRGEAEASIRAFAAGMDQVIVPGWIDAAQIWALMQASSFGLLPYRPTLDYSRSLPNKVFEYLNGGLPIVTSLRGVIEQFFADIPCGVLYDFGDPSSLRDAIGRLVSTPGELARLKEIARASASKFDANAICADFEAYVTRVATGSLAKPTPKIHS